VCKALNGDATLTRRYMRCGRRAQNLHDGSIRRRHRVTRQCRASRGADELTSRM
jgi:hypothetical protein